MSQRSLTRIGRSAVGRSCVETLEGRQLLAVAALYYNPIYTDSLYTSGASAAIQTKTELTVRGYTVRTFNDFSASSLSTALTGADLVVFPRFGNAEKDSDSLPTSEVSEAAKTTLRNFVAGGGGYLQVGDSAFSSGAEHPTTYENDELLSTLFGYGAMTRAPALTGTLTYNSAAAVGTTFATGAPSPLTVQLLTVTTTLASGTPAKSIYTLGASSAVTFFNYAGRYNVGMLSYDYMFGSTPGWETVMTKALDQVKRTSTTPTTPAAPSNLAGTAASTTQINLTWTDNATNETGFRIDRATNSTFTTGLVSTTAAANATSASVTGLTANTTYYFRITALNGSLTSAASNTATVKTLATATAPAAPTTLAGTAVSTTQINLTWKDNATNETGFRIDRAINSTFTTGLVSTTAAANAQAASITGLTANTTYYFRVVALNGVLASAASNIATIKTLATNPTAPAAPTGLISSVISSSQINLAWKDNATNETGYRIERATNSTFTAGLVQTTAVANATFATLTGLAAGTTYYFRVFALNGTTVSAASNVVSATTKTATGTAPSAPTTLAGTAVSTTQINLTWKDNATNETGFRIDRATNSTFTTGLVSTTAAANAQAASITGLTANTTYYFRVVALNGALASAASNTATIKTLATVTAPAAPTGLVAAVVSKSQINLAWKDNATNETGYRIERATNSTFTAGLVTTTVAANAGFAQITGLTANTTYYFRVVALLNSTASSPSNVVSAKTLA
ncbi:MAG: fibronectin type III domain-containing protein [Tepidisphaeraceae bacterium]